MNILFLTTIVALFICSNSEQHFASVTMSLPRTRLVDPETGAATTSEDGLLQMYKNPGGWRYVKADESNRFFYPKNVATVACKEMGYQTSGTISRGATPGSTKSVSMWVVRCKGNEANLSECSSKSMQFHYDFQPNDDAVRLNCSSQSSEGASGVSVTIIVVMIIILLLCVCALPFVCCCSSALACFSCYKLANQIEKSRDIESGVTTPKATNASQQSETSKVTESGGGSMQDVTTPKATNGSSS